MQLVESNGGGGEESRAAESRAKNHFLSTLSHELRTPMTVFMGMVELALNTELTEEQRSYLTTAMSSAEKLLEIIEDLLDFAQMEQGKIPFASEPFALHSCVYRAIEKSVPLARRKGLSISVSLAEGLPEIIVGDGERLRQALEKLIDNAVKFTDQGRISVTARADTDAHTLSFSVKDTGIGIPEEKQSSIFQSFTQLEETNVRRFGGMGLGLALARRIAVGMGGHLEVDSRAGAGSEFTLVLPWRPVPCGAAAPDASRPGAELPYPERAWGRG